MVNFFPINGNIPSLIAKEDGRKDLRHVPDFYDLWKPAGAEEGGSRGYVPFSLVL